MFNLNNFNIRAFNQQPFMLKRFKVVEIVWY